MSKCFNNCVYFQSWCGQCELQDLAIEKVSAGHKKQMSHKQFSAMGFTAQGVLNKDDDCEYYLEKIAY